MSSRPEVTCTTIGPAAVVSVAGAVDVRTSHAIEDATWTCLAPAATPVIADYTRVTGMDATGVRLQLRVQQRLDATGRRFVLATSSPAVLRMLAVSGVDQIITIAATVQDAVAVLG